MARSLNCYHMSLNNVHCWLAVVDRHTRAAWWRDVDCPAASVARRRARMYT